MKPSIKCIHKRALPSPCCTSITSREFLKKRFLRLYWMRKLRLGTRNRYFKKLNNSSKYTRGIVGKERIQCSNLCFYPQEHMTSYPLLCSQSLFFHLVGPSLRFVISILPIITFDNVMRKVLMLPSKHHSVPMGFWEFTCLRDRRFCWVSPGKSSLYFCKYLKGRAARQFLGEWNLFTKVNYYDLFIICIE